MSPLARAVLAGLAAPLVLWLGSFVVGLEASAPRTIAMALVPVLIVLPFYPTFAALVASGALRRAVTTSLAWAASVSVATIVYVLWCDTELVAVDALIWNARAYREDMFHWIVTGIGQEGSPATFIPQHALHFAGFALLTLVSRGFLGLVLGAALLDYMNAYVAALLMRSAEPWSLVPLAWPAYALVRVVGFICVATALAAFVSVRFRRLDAIEPPTRFTPRIRAVLWTGVALVLCDLALKSWLAPVYGRLFQRFTDLAG